VFTAQQQIQVPADAGNEYRGIQIFPMLNALAWWTSDGPGTACEKRERTHCYARPCLHTFMLMASHLDTMITRHLHCMLLGKTCRFNGW
jgi:hypothetical protein